MFKFLDKFFKQQNFSLLVDKINSLELEIEKLSDNELKEKSLAFKKRITNTMPTGGQGDFLDAILPEAFALCREAAKRTLGQRHFDVQLIGGIVLHQGKISEMATGEGKTLTATLAAYLNGLTGNGVHIITVNDYLAERDAVWMGQIYDFLGLTVGCLGHEAAYIYDKKQTIENNEQESFKVLHEFLRPATRKEAYQCDILYGTNHEFGFDYLRDNLVHDLNQQVQRVGFNFAIIDEVDSILIDEARTPLIISAPNAESSEYYKIFSRLVAYLDKDTDYIVDEKAKSVSITDSGINKIEGHLKIDNLYSPDNLKLAHYLEESLKAKALFSRDKNYIVEKNEIIIIDEFTGRKMYGRRYSGGLHQALEAKENVAVQQESKTLAKITIQNYFRLYQKLAGMTGTAQTSAEEFHKVYNLEVVSIPTNKPMIRKDQADLIYKNFAAKMRAVVAEVKERHQKGQPVLIGTASIENNEILSAILRQAGVPHEILNAKNHEREGQIIAQAGKIGAVTVATNMAGRGVDIILGGNPPDKSNAEEVKKFGGLYVIGTERHDARRIDNQLRGRSGRQGDFGESRFFLSLEDDLLRIFGGEKIKSLMSAFNLPEDQPIESRLVSKIINEAQKKVEGFNFDSRKHLLEYDDVLNKQRMAVYKKRQEILETDSEQSEIKSAMLSIIDTLWMNHLENMEALLEAVSLRAYGQHDPLVEYRRESNLMYKEMMANFEEWIKQAQNDVIPAQRQESGDIVILAKAGIQRRIDNPLDPRLRGDDNMQNKKIGRNDSCPCGSGKKYKKCHGK